MLRKKISQFCFTFGRNIVQSPDEAVFPQPTMMRWLNFLHPRVNMMERSSTSHSSLTPSLCFLAQVAPFSPLGTQNAIFSWRHGSVCFCIYKTLETLVIMERSNNFFSPNIRMSYRHCPGTWERTNMFRQERHCCTLWLWNEWKSRMWG